MNETGLKRLVVIDGKSVFYRGYYAMPGLTTKEGVYVFVAMAMGGIKRLKPDYVCVAWDKPKTNIRKRLEIYPQYKAGRKAPPEDFYTQIPILIELLSAFNWPFYELDDYEADDIMATLAKKAEKENIETLLVTSDMDALQSISPLTHVYTLKTGLTNISLFTEQAFEEKYQLKVHQFVDLKSIMGDSSDNIPGVPGVGTKGATELLLKYETLDGIYEHIDELKGSLQTKMIAGKESAYMSKRLATMMFDAPVEVDREAMDVAKLDVQKLREILTKLEFRTLLKNLPDFMQVVPGLLQNGAQESMGPRLHGDDAQTGSGFGLDLSAKVELVEDEDKVEELIKKLGSHKSDVVVSSRARGKMGKDPLYLVVSLEQKSAYILDLEKLMSEAGTGSETGSESGKKLVAEFIQELVKHPLVGHDIKLTLHMLLELGVDNFKVAFDTMIGAFLINSLVRSLSLTELAESDLGYSGSSLENLSDEDLVMRAGELSELIWLLYRRQGEQMAELTKLVWLAENLEFPVIATLARMEHHGMSVNKNELEKFSEELSLTISDLEQEIYGHAEHEFNIASPVQLSQILFEKLGLSTLGNKKGKNGAFSTAVDELTRLKESHPIISLVMHYREVTKIKNNYLDALPKLAEDLSGVDKIRSTFLLTNAQTGRLSSLDPNLQNIPVRTPLGKRIRDSFVASPGKVLISADYSQFELAEDKEMIETFSRDEDVHAVTAAVMNDVPLSEVTKDMRYNAKTVNFGVLYGQGPHGLSIQTGMSFSDARKFIDKYFDARPLIKAYIDRIKDDAKNKGYVENLLGRRRPTPDVNSSNFMVREGAYRAAINMPIQGTAADLTKYAMVKLEQAIDAQTWSGPKPYLVLQIHDSIMLECAPADLEDTMSLTKKIMENIYDLGVKLSVDVSSGGNWGEL
jgi:DNA polymerase I